MTAGEDGEKALRVFVVAGEASGDLLGASVLSALRETHPQAVMAGVGGEMMQAQGLHSLFPMEDLSVMGVFEVLPRLPLILRRMRETVRAAESFSPDVVLTIDSPDFCFRVVRRLKKRLKNAAFVHYVAPSVWAWRPGRAKKVARFLDHILALLPFEPPYFERHGLAATFVGHPVVEKAELPRDGAAFRVRHGIAAEQPVVCLLPGSRMSEITRLLPCFLETVKLLLRDAPDARVIMPTLPHLSGFVGEVSARAGLDVLVLDDADEKLYAFAASDVALAASGTVSLELAMTETPHVVAYRMGAVSGFLARRLIRTPYVNLVNIILQRPVVPEMLLENCAPVPLHAAIIRLLTSKDARETQLGSFRAAMIALGLGASETPGQKSARVLLNSVKK